MKHTHVDVNDNMHERVRNKKENVLGNVEVNVNTSPNAECGNLVQIKRESCCWEWSRSPPSKNNAAETTT